MDSIRTQLQTARGKGVPLIALETSDQPGAAELVRSCMLTQEPILCWDAARGLRAATTEAMPLIGLLSGSELPPGSSESEMARRYRDAEAQVASDTAGSLAAALGPLRAVGSRWVLVALGADREVIGQDAARVVAGLLGHRDVGASRMQMVILAGPAPWSLPADLRSDVLVLSDPLPDDADREAIIAKLLSENGLGADALPAAIEATRGLSRFAVEQSAALCTVLSTRSLDVAALWERARSVVSQVPGLSMAHASELPKLSDIAGNVGILSYYRRLFAGPARPSAIVLVDEIEKTGLSQAEGDLSGTSRDQLGAILEAMERHQWEGALLVGQPGSGKTMLAHALAGEYGLPLLRVDLGQAKGSLVGQSEQQTRAILETVWAVAGARAYWMGSSNSIASLPPALLRRFSDGRWYFDLLSAPERDQAWRHYCARYRVEDAARPADAGWTGAEIRNCAKKAWRLGCSLREAGGYIVPIARSDPRALSALRDEADGHYLDASREPGPGGEPAVYRRPEEGTEVVFVGGAPGRTIES